MRATSILFAVLLLPSGLCRHGRCGEPAYPIAFSDVTRPAGLVEPLAGLLGHGAAWGDFDGDGLVDLFVGGFCDRPDGEYRPRTAGVGGQTGSDAGLRLSLVAS